MKRNLRASTAIAGALALGVGLFAIGHGAMAADTANPFAKASTLPFQAPPFDKIKDTDYEPAFAEGMRQQIAAIEKIANNPAAPTFANTIVAMERSSPMLDRVSQVFDNINGANTSDALQKIDEFESPKRAAHQDAINLNAKLFKRVQTLYEKRDRLKLTTEQRMLLKVYYDGFIHSGAKLSDADQTKLRALNEQLSTLQTAFTQKLLAAAKAGALVVDDKAALAGLSPGAIDSAADAAKGRGLAGKWLIPLQNTTQQPSLESLDNRATREALFKSGWMRAEKGDANDTRGLIQKIAHLRAQKADLLGYKTWADYVLQDQMAKTPKAVESFLDQLTPPVRAESIKEAADIQAVIDKQGGGFKVAPWDWDHYAEQVRKARYDLDQNQVKPYFELHKVLTDGVFYAANRLYGLTFKKRTDIPVYQSDVMVYEVTDKDGKPLGLMYFDYFKRDNKSGGAWMSNFVGQSKLLGTKPVIYNVANFTKPAAGQPALISSDDVTTMFHEFGHALHGLFADQVYPSLSGTSVARDFVEFPSQFNEHWALDPQVFKHYAVHYQTGAPMPQALVDKIKKARTFNQGYAFGEVLAAAELDMQWHDLPASAPEQDVDAFETAALKKAGADFPDVPPRYRSSYFLHIWANGYSAGYYAYIWTEMLDDDAFAWFEQNGGLTRKNGQRFRDMILSRGHTLDYGPMFKAFYGKDPDIGPLLEHRGLPAAGKP
jgi:peptidyl-dipeptidase Dcp